MQAVALHKELHIPLLKEGAARKINSPEKLVASLREEIFSERRECLGVVALDTRNNVIWHGIVHIGTLDYAPSHPREIFRQAIASASAGIVVVHNHPSGEVKPSREDVEIAEILKTCGEILGIPLLDFVIVAGEGFFSFAREGLV